MKSILLVLTVILLFSFGQTSQTKTHSVEPNCSTGSFGLKTDFAIGESTGNQVDCYNVWTDYTLRLINGKPQWTSGRYGSNFYDNNAIDGNCYTCEHGSGKFSPGAVQNWQAGDGSFSRYICRVVNQGGNIHAKWVHVAKCN